MPDERTEAQRAADDNLEKAIAECAQAYDFLRDGQAPGDWMVYLEIANFDPDLAGKTNYVVLLPGSGGIPWHRIIGLHVLAGKTLEDQRRQDGE